MKERIKALCRQRNITLKELAAAIGVTPDALQKSLAADMRVSTLQRIADALGVTVAALLDGDAAQSPGACRCPKCGASLRIVAE